MAAKSVSRVIVAADDPRILDALDARGFEGVKTAAEHQSGTDRVAEVARNLDTAEIIVNVQGDEPLISPETIDNAVAAINEAGVGIATTWEPIELMADVLNPDVVKIVLDESDRALYFSRAPVPFPSEEVREYGSIEEALRQQPSLVSLFRKHTGLYVYRRDVLLDFAGWPQTALEQLESLEQLRALEHGVVIRAVKAASPSIGVDTLADLERVRNLIGLIGPKSPI